VQCSEARHTTITPHYTAPHNKGAEFEVELSKYW